MKHALLFALVALSGCPASTSTATSTGPAASAASPTSEAPGEGEAGAAAGAIAVDDDPTCPLLVPGTKVIVEDNSLLFTTTGDLAAVRERGNALAAMHNTRNGPAGALGMRITAASHAHANHAAGGVRVEFTPENPAAAAPLSEEIVNLGNSLAGAASCAP